MTKPNPSIQEQIESKIIELGERIEAGEKIMKDCKKQMRVLKAKLKEYKRIKVQVAFVSVSDGDL